MPGTLLSPPKGINSFHPDSNFEVAALPSPLYRWGSRGTDEVTCLNYTDFAVAGAERKQSDSSTHVLSPALIWVFDHFTHHLPWVCSTASLGEPSLQKCQRFFFPSPATKCQVCIRGAQWLPRNHMTYHMSPLIIYFYESSKWYQHFISTYLYLLI